MTGLFDLNIEQVLENWSVADALREIIANALDEQLLTKSKPIEITKINDTWHIRDYGRGLQYRHFTQNENEEKLQATNLIGKFGVGLKDALAVFDRHGCGVRINSRYNTVTICKSEKHGFDLETLHAEFAEPLDLEMIGTEFCITNISDKDMEEAKSRFLVFNGQQLLETTKYGAVYAKTKALANIYINGVLVATEENFMFSYNITKIDTKIRKALNRERTNVGRVAYTDTVKKILLACTSERVLTLLCKDLVNVSKGLACDETKWSDIAAHAARLLDTASDNNYVFMTAAERAQLTNDEVEVLQESGKEIITVTDTVMNNIQNTVTTFHTVYETYCNSYTYNFIDRAGLTDAEQRVFDLKKHILKIFKERFEICPNILISETIKVDAFGEHADGTCNFSDNLIIIRRDVLKDAERFCGVLLHELAHYQNGHTDNTRAFEDDLTNMLGFITHYVLRTELIATATATAPPAQLPEAKPKLIHRVLRWLSH